MNTKMHVIKRDGTRAEFMFDEITKRLKALSFGLSYVDPAAVTRKVAEGVYAGMATKELDELASITAASMTYIHYEYSILAARLLISNMHMAIDADYGAATKRLRAAGLVSESYAVAALTAVDRLNELLDHSRDYEYTYFGLKTLENGYLMRVEGRVAERPQHMLMRVAVGIHGDDYDAVRETYDMMSRGLFTHASPTMFAAGTDVPQMSSCFLTAVEDSIDGIYGKLHECAKISKYSGGIGAAVSGVRARGSHIKGINGTASGVVNMARVYNDMVRHVDQGGKRKGAMALYLEPWHADVEDFLALKRNMGVEEKKARDLTYGLWVPDLFMRRVNEDAMWSLMCPNRCPNLNRVHGKEFDELYSKYESEGRFVKQMKARDLHRLIVETQVETGMPYMLYKDACNAKSNQRNLGTIQCSNLCAEIVEYNEASSEIAVCNLASIAVNRFVAGDRYDYYALKRAVGVCVRNLNKIVDNNFYPIKTARASNYAHRPIGVGVQGLADAFAMLRMPYESEAARALNKQIAETIYYGALEASCELARDFGPYSSYEGSPASRGELQFDAWNVQPSPLWDWVALKAQIATHGLRNSLLVAYMPTATTAQILGNNESFEPFTSNLYLRRVLCGEFQVVNKYLVDDLMSLGLYDAKMRNDIMANGGSVQNINTIPKHIKELYKTVWEMSIKTMIEMAAERGAFIDQSQSFNLFMAQPTYKLLSSVHHYGWQRGLKTGMYYLHTKPAANAIKITLDECGKDCFSCQA